MKIKSGIIRNIVLFLLVLGLVALVNLVVHELGHCITIDAVGGTCEGVYVLPGIKIWPLTGFGQRYAWSWDNYIGLTLFVGYGRGQSRRQLPNYLLWVVFVAVFYYFTFVHPDLAARIVSLSLGLLVIFAQWLWLLLRQADPGLRPITRGLGVISGIYCLVSLVRIFMVLAYPHPALDFFQSGLYDALILLAYQILLTLRTFGLALMVNQRLLKELQEQEAKFSGAFRSAPFAKSAPPRPLICISTCIWAAPRR